MKKTACLLSLSVGMAAPVVKKQPTPEPAVIVDGASPTRMVQYGERDVVPITTQLKITTLITLPERESMVNVICGDKDNWVINASANLVFIRPTPEATRTNLNVLMSSGNLYSFLLTNDPKVSPDFKVFVQLKETSPLMAAALSDANPRFVSFDEVKAYKEQVQVLEKEKEATAARAQEEIAAAKKRAEAEVTKARVAMPADLKHDYDYTSTDKFQVAAMWHDKQFTYIAANMREAPVLYELIDKKPNLVQFQLKDGIYVVSKVLDRGYLAKGKDRMHFTHIGKDR
jgi:type IV secretory pathway VirB9-like protein